MLSHLGPAEGREILQGLLEGSAFDLMKNGNSKDRSRGEIVNP